MLPVPLWVLAHSQAKVSLLTKGKKHVTPVACLLAGCVLSPDRLLGARRGGP